MIKSTILKQLGKLVFNFTSRLAYKTLLLDEGKNQFFKLFEYRFPYLLVFLLATKISFAQTIEEKKKSYQMEKGGNELGVFLYQLNQKLKILRQQLQGRYERVNLLFEKGEKEEEYHALLKEVKELRSEISLLENKWHDLAVEETKREDEGYAIWDQEETTLSQLIMEYGSNDYLYVVPPEILSMKLHMHSNIPIPRESWSSLLEIILSHNGIGIKQLNPYARQLYVLKQDLIAVDTILNNQKALSDLPPKS
ncbi:MAG: hypothetical protein HYZ47_00755, partial [Simkania negevensis]|nr:hypothetical protein [Simkania negevensis]